MFYRNCFLASHFGTISPLDIITGNRLDVYYRSSGAQWTSCWQFGGNTTKVSKVTVFIFWFWCLEKLEALVLSQANSHWFVFAKTVLSFWEHVLISLLGYYHSHTVGSVAKYLLLPKSQNVYFSANYKWPVRRFDGLSLCLVIDRTLLKKKFTLWKGNWYFSAFPNLFFFERPINKIIFN